MAPVVEVPFLFDGAVTDALDEDLLQAGVCDLETDDTLAAREGGLEDRLRIGARGDVHLEVVLPATRERHARDLLDPTRAIVALTVHRRARASGGPIGLLHRKTHNLAAHAPLDLAQWPRLHYAAAVDDRDRLAQLLDLLHLVCAEDQRLAPVAHLEEGLLQELDVHRVQAR